MSDISLQIGTREEWLTARKSLLAEERALTAASDKIKEQLRKLPLVPVTKPYQFQPVDGHDKEEGLPLAGLFGPHSQLIVYHFMFDTDWDEGCRGCSFMAGNFPNLRYLGAKDTAFAAVSRAAPAKLAAFRDKNGWVFPWYSIGPDGEFNHDFGVTVDVTKGDAAEYNFETKAEVIGRGSKWQVGDGEMPGMSVFVKDKDGKVYHSYSSYARGLDHLLPVFSWLDLTPKGRQVDANGPGDFKLPYEYEEEDKEKETKGVDDVSDVFGAGNRGMGRMGKQVGLN
jgi:predicted dithiol-disulfide oxidoreductase (DUF899 family)